MASYKDTFESWFHSAWTYASGMWRGKGVTTTTQATYFIPLEGPSQEYFVLSIDGSIELADFATWEDGVEIVWEDDATRVWEEYVGGSDGGYLMTLEGPS